MATDVLSNRLHHIIMTALDTVHDRTSQGEPLISTIYITSITISSQICLRSTKIQNLNCLLASDARTKFVHASFMSKRPVLAWTHAEIHLPIKTVSTKYTHVGLYVCSLAQI